MQRHLAISYQCPQGTGSRLVFLSPTSGQIEGELALGDSEARVSVQADALFVLQRGWNQGVRHVHEAT